MPLDRQHELLNGQGSGRRARGRRPRGVPEQGPPDERCGAPLVLLLLARELLLLQEVDAPVGVSAEALRLRQGALQRKGREPEGLALSSEGSDLHGHPQLRPQGADTGQAETREGSIRCQLLCHF